MLPESRRSRTCRQFRHAKERSALLITRFSIVVLPPGRLRMDAADRVGAMENRKRARKPVKCVGHSRAQWIRHLALYDGAQTGTRIRLSFGKWGRGFGNVGRRVS